MLLKGDNKFQQQKVANRWEKYEVRKEYSARGEELICLQESRVGIQLSEKKERNLNKRIPLSGKYYVISPVPTSFCSGYLLLYSNTIKICEFSENKYPSFLPPKQGICKRILMQISFFFSPRCKNYSFFPNKLY